MLLVSCVVLLTLLLDRQAEVDGSTPGEDAVWAVYQLDRETVKLDAALSDYMADPTPRLAGEVALRYDILYSRTTLLRGGQLAAIIAIVPEDAERASRIVDMIERLAPGDETPDRRSSMSRPSGLRSGDPPNDGKSARPDQCAPFRRSGGVP